MGNCKKVLLRFEEIFQEFTSIFRKLLQGSDYLKFFIFYTLPVALISSIVFLDFFLSLSPRIDF